MRFSTIAPGRLLHYWQPNQPVRVDLRADSAFATAQAASACTGDNVALSAHAVGVLDDELGLES
jgi:hypothetical protein